MNIRHLRLKFILTFAAIIISVAIAFIIIAILINGERWHSGIINISGRQRMLSQKIALLSLELANSDDRDQQEQIRDDLKNSIVSMRSSHDDLVHGNGTRNLSGARLETINNIYFDEPHFLDRNTNDYLEEADDLADEGGVITPDNEHLQRILATAPKLLVSLDAVVEIHQIMSEEDLTDLQLTGLGLFIFIVGISLVAGFYMVRPTLSKVKDDTAQLKKMNKKLKQLSTIDELTNLENRRSFNDYIIKEWDRAKRSKNPLSVLMVDIDYFKNFNDSFGHQAGDECLASIASLMKSTFRRPSDFVARYGGEEFIAVLPDTGLDGAKKVSENLRKRVEDLYFKHPSSKVSNVVTISVGVSTSTTKTSSFENLIATSDKAMYHAKELGRNQVHATYDESNELKKPA